MAREKTLTRRGSPDVIAKRRAARSLNRIFMQAATVTPLDGRTLKRKTRLAKELAEGRDGEALKPHEVLTYVTELLGMGETMTTIRALKPLLPGALPLTDESVSVIKDTQTSYGFDPRAWKLIGIDIEAIMSGVPVEPKPARKKRGRRKKA